MDDLLRLTNWLNKPRKDGTRPKNKAAVATQIAVETDSPDFVLLTERIRELRWGGKRGRPPLWVEKLWHWSDEELAAATLYHLVRAHHDYDEGFPFFTTIGTALGAALIEWNDPNEQLTVGCQLLGLAEKEGVTVKMQGVREEYRVAFSRRSLRRLNRIIIGAARHVLRLVREQPPSGEVETRKKYNMRLTRPETPPRVVEAVDKVRGTAWRINLAVLAQLDGVDDQIAINLVTDKEQRKNLKRILAEAHQLATLERFYFPVFLDFRGRVNQHGGLLQYTNAPDYARGLLEFADGERVDPLGFKWLTWHMAQMWGKDLPDLPLGDGTTWLRTAADILGRDRWRHAKDPVQFLAAALAVKDASEGRPVHLPVRVDATCSGLQHLALLLRDQDLAESVSLWGNYDLTGRRDADPKKPADFYRRVADLTEFDRDHVKAVIVPLLYGAGIKTLTEGLAEKREKPLTKCQKEDAKKIRGAAKQLAPRAFGLLRWFSEVAEAHNKHADVPVRWTLPTGFEVIQDYRVVDKITGQDSRKVQIIINGERRNLRKRAYTNQIWWRKQTTSMPPNIVHSLDAAFLTELVTGSRIDQWGVIHDAFAVPANRVWELVDDDSPRALGALYRPDLLAQWVTAWRENGVDVDDPPGGTRGPLPGQMLGGLRTLG